MATKLTPTGVKFKDVDIEQPRPVVSVNGTAPDDLGNIEVSAGGGATYTNQKYHASNDFLFKDSKWYGGHVVYSYSSNETEIENLSVGSVLHEVSSDLSFSVVSIDADSNTITLNRNDFVDLDTSDKTLEDRENSTFGSTTFTYISGANNSLKCTNIWLQVKGNENHANTTTLPTTDNSVANLPMKLDHLPSVATHIIFRVSSGTGGSFKIYNRESFNTRPATAELLPSEIVHQVDVEDDSGTQSGVSEFRVPVNSYFRFWVTGGAKANLYPVGYSVLDLSEIDLQSASNPVIDDLQNQITSNDTDISNLQGNITALQASGGVTTVNGQTGDVTVSIPTDLNDLTDNNQLLSSGGGRVLVFTTSDTYTKPAGVTQLEIIIIGGGGGGGSDQNLAQSTKGGDSSIDNIPLYGTLIASGSYSGSSTYADSENPKLGVYGTPNSDAPDLRGESLGFLGGRKAFKYNTNDTILYGATNASVRPWTPPLKGSGRSSNTNFNNWDKIYYGTDGGWGSGATSSSSSPNGISSAPSDPGFSWGAEGWTVNYTDQPAEVFNGRDYIGAGAPMGYTSTLSGGYAEDGERKIYIVDVNSSSSTHNVQVGAGGDGCQGLAYANYYYYGAGGGQGIVIIKEISDLTKIS